ncbi:hypothetical protein ZIOFF_035675 [Zingiber officinale]|uniref:Uncharacterized protein n=1 Tax=Zingiber officinale TaxID=94328 RepID=A0A8J5KXW1_ZINOF|nr:hypothetical protein ZIOFF_035675 [Zingiber officinale]
MGNGDHKCRSNQGDQQRSSDDDSVRWEGCVEFKEGSDGGSDGRESLARTRSLMDGDLEELKGCLGLGFDFIYDKIPGL